jgi:acetyl-CoA carboxylase carboxyltransferase component
MGRACYENPGWALALSAVAERSMQERLEELERRRQAALHAGSESAVERQHSRGKMTARERLDYLLDAGSFQELDMLARSRAEGAHGERSYTDGVVTGFGTVDGKKVCLFSQDFTVNGGTLGEVSGEKIHKIIDLATSLGVPLIGINDGGGARVQEGVVALHYYGGIFKRNVAASGVVPQISVIMGSCAGGAVYSPAITDFVFMVQGSSQMFITGPDVVKTVTGEDVTLEELGGALTPPQSRAWPRSWPPMRNHVSTGCASCSLISPPTTWNNPRWRTTASTPWSWRPTWLTSSPLPRTSPMI